MYHEGNMHYFLMFIISMPRAGGFTVMTFSNRIIPETNKFRIECRSKKKANCEVAYLRSMETEILTINALQRSIL